MLTFKNNFLTSLLLVLTLLGVQVIQHSPLHDHNDHDVVDCGLCHFDSASKVTLEKSPLPELEQTGFLYQEETQHFALSKYFSFSQARAPPAIFS